MITLNNRRLAGAISFASIVGLVLLMGLTNPVENIIYTVLFFGLALAFLISTGHFIVRLQVGEVNSKNRYRIIAVSLIIMILLMFRSAQSLSLVDGIILILISFGLVFYISRRSH